MSGSRLSLLQLHFGACTANSQQSARQHSSRDWLLNCVLGLNSEMTLEAFTPQAQDRNQSLLHCPNFADQ